MKHMAWLLNMAGCHAIGGINNKEVISENHWTQDKAQAQVVDSLKFISGDR